MSCDACPCPLLCTGAEVYCRWAASADPVLVRHVRDKHAGVVARPAQSPADRLELARAITLAAGMERCPYRSTKGCGCGGALCSLRGAGRVTHLDCFECLKVYPD